MNHCRWNVLPPAPESLIAVSPFPHLVTQLFYNRGLTDPAQFQSFLADDAPENDPRLLPDMEKAVSRIYRALLSGESMAVYGDFDVDGVTATAILAYGLNLLGGKVVPYIPHRLTEGYGIKAKVLEDLRNQGISLVITVDCGITAVAEVKRAARIKLDVIITDHHTPLPEIPPALAVVNTRLPGSSYPFPELTGAGVAFKLIEVLLRGLGREEQLVNVLDLVALGTVADMAPLLGENRCLVKRGLKVINETPRIGLKEIIDLAGLNTGDIDAQTISWILAPRLNAAGRLAHAMSSYQLLTTESADEARRLAQWLEGKNAERQQLTGRALTRAREEILSRGMAPLLISHAADYPVGVAGLVANRLSEEFYRPSLVVRTGDYSCSGSCRSIPEFNIALALQSCGELLTNFGGHAQAAGFTLPARNLPRFEAMLTRLAAEHLTGVDLRPRVDIDAEVSLKEFNSHTFPVIQQLAPFGRGNPLPTFLSRKVAVADCRTMGNGGEHLRLKLKQDSAVWDAVAFRSSEYLGEIKPVIDIVYNLEMDRWRGTERLRLNILDFASPS